MKTVKRAAFAIAVQRYNRAKKASKDVALASLVKEGTHTQEGKITKEYGGEAEKKSANSAR